MKATICLLSARCAGSGQNQRGVWHAVHLLPRSEWQAAPAGSAQNDDIDESDSEEPEVAEAAVSEAQPGYAGEPQQSKSVLNGAMKQLQLHGTANRMVMIHTNGHHQGPYFLSFRLERLEPHHEHLCRDSRQRYMADLPCAATTATSHAASWLSVEIMPDFRRLTLHACMQRM